MHMQRVGPVHLWWAALLGVLLLVHRAEAGRHLAGQGTSQLQWQTQQAAAQAKQQAGHASTTLFVPGKRRHRLLRTSSELPQPSHLTFHRLLGRVATGALAPLAPLDGVFPTALTPFPTRISGCAGTPGPAATAPGAQPNARSPTRTCLLLIVTNRHFEGCIRIKSL